MATNYRKAMLDLAEILVGSEVPATHEIFMDAYNKWLAKSKNRINGTHWSAVFITYLARSSGVPTAIIPNFATVAELQEWATKRKLFSGRGDAPYVIAPGDLLLFEDKTPDHVAIYIQHIGNKVEYIEGTVQGLTYSVQRKTRINNSGKIIGVVHPDYDWVKSKGLINPTQLSSLMKPVRIQEFRAWLENTYGSEFINQFVSGTPKGNFTKGWTRVAIAAWQTEMHLGDLDPSYVDGDFEGEAVLHAASEKPIKVNSRGNRVMILIGMLYVKGYDPKGWTTRFGANGRAALEAFQKARALPITGIADFQVWESLFK